MEEYIVGLDLGTTKVCAVVGVLDKNGRVNVKGVGKVTARGIEKGRVESVTRTAECIKEAVKIAGDQANVDIAVVNVGIAGYHVKSLKDRCYHLIDADEKIISEKHVNKLIEEAKRIRVNHDETIIHVFPEEYIIDYDLRVRDPIGTKGGRIEGIFNIITANSGDIDRIRMSVQAAGLQVAGIFYQPLASAESILIEKEKQAGVVVIDIGGGSTDLAVFMEGNLVFATVIPMGGVIINRDIETECSIVDSTAVERLKIQHGVAFEDFCDKKMIISVDKGLPHHPPVEISHYNLTMIIQKRLEEIFSQIHAILVKQGFSKYNLKAGVVMTGGTAQLLHIKELFELMTGLPTRIGMPGDSIVNTVTEEVKKSSFATVVGLVKLGGLALQQSESSTLNQKIIEKNTEPKIDYFSKITSKIKNIWSIDNLFGTTNSNNDYN